MLFIMLFQLSWFSHFCTPPPSNPTPSGNPPPPLFVSMAHMYKFFGTLFPTLYFTSPWLFCNYLFVLLNPLTSSLILLFPTPIWQPLSNYFSLAFKSLSLFLTFVFLIIMCLGVGLFAPSILFGTLCFLDLHVCFLHQIRKVFFHYFFK